MRYEGSIYRPPSEARSYILQVTIGCAHNNCTFCSMFKDKQFRLRNMEDILEDIHMAKNYYGDRIERVFLADGDALCLSNEKLIKIIEEIHSVFTSVKRISVYGAPQDVLRKTQKELKELREAGVEIIYIGGESGNPKVLKDIKKGASREEIIEAVKKIENSGIKASVTFISGLGGRDNWKTHAIDTGTMISQMNPSYVGLLTLMLEPMAPLTKDVENGNFEILSGMEVLKETKLLLENINVEKSCVFRSNHASNYVSLRGNLPEDKEIMIGQLEVSLGNESMLKDERFRLL